MYVLIANKYFVHVMTEAEKALKDLSLNYTMLIRGRSYLIKPKNLLFEDIELVLIKQEEDKYELSWWRQNYFARTIKFTKTLNILNAYNSLYQYSLRTLTNERSKLFESNPREDEILEPSESNSSSQGEQETEINQ